MPHWFKRTVLAAVCLGSTSLGSSAFAQQDAMAELYGQGVHHYFAGDYAGAELLLNQVLSGGSTDPRVHYFLGLCKVQQGGGAMAGMADFEAGATAEATSKNAYQIGQALQRIQGSVRAEIEKARINARAVARQQQLAQQRARMDTGAGAGAGPGAAMGTLPTAPVQPSAPTQPAAPADAAASDPFGAEGVRSDAATVDPVQPTAPDTSNPFGDDPSVPAPSVPGAPATAPAADDPFSAPGTPATPAMDDPFGT